MATAAPEIPSVARDRAFENLYRRHVKDVYHYALALLRDPADAEDVTQTTFMNAYRAFKRGEEIEKPQNWLIKIAHNVARSRYARSTRRVREVPLEDHIDQLALPEDEKPDVEAVLDALGRLPLNQRAALVMRELEGRTYAEIADTLGVSVPAVETLIFRGRRSLRLKASAIRVLSIVPVPTSLSQLFGAGGTAVVGGGAIVGSGFLFKAAVAILAGVAATGVAGGDRSPKAAAAAAAHAVHGDWAIGAERARVADRRPVGRSLLVTIRSTARVITRDKEIHGTVVTSRRATLPHDDAIAATSPSGVGRAGATPSTTAAGASAPSSAVGSVTSSPTTTVASAAQTATATLPVAAPPPPAVSVPPLPVQPPPLPQPPPPPPLP
jgi:RNA polymerase sigma factor (sigma-70 family)